MQRIFFISPDNNSPIGGIKKLYRQADILRRHGIDAKILHYKKGFRPNWFTNTTPITTWSEIRWKDDDILVIPEIYGPGMSKKLRIDIDKTFFNRSGFFEIALPPVRKVIFNQNCYYTFARHGFDNSIPDTPYLDPLVIGTIVVSEDSREYLRSIFPQLKIYRITNAIDPILFSFQRIKQKQLCFMPRKHREEAQEVLNIAKLHKALDGYTIKPIEGLKEQETAALMRDSLIFLSFGYPEGFALPPAEAMAAGCIVIGYHGGGGREYFLPEHSFPIEAADIRSFVQTLESVTQQYSVDPSALDEKRMAASEYIHNHYSPEKEESDICVSWSEILGRSLS